MPKPTFKIGESYVVVGGKYGGRQGVLKKLTPMKARIQFDGEESTHLVDQSFIRRGVASAPESVGDQVAIVKGKYAGLKGSIHCFTTEMVYVLLSDGSCPRINQSSVVCIRPGVSQPTVRKPSPVMRTPFVDPVRRTTTRKVPIRTVSPTPSCDEQDYDSDVAVKVYLSRHRGVSTSTRRVPRTVRIEVEYD